MEGNFEANASHLQAKNQEMGSVAGETEKGSSEICEQLGKKDLAAGGAVTLQANRIWLVFGATVTLDFLKKSMPRMGPATAACKNLDSKKFVLKQDGFGNKSPRGDWLSICPL
jgi:hypothetical protein